MLRKDGVRIMRKAGPGNPMLETWARSDRGTGHKQIGRINTAKMTTLPEAIYRSSAVPSKIPRTLFTELEQNFKNLYGTKKTQNCQSNAEEKQQTGLNPPRNQAVLQKATGSKQCGIGIKTDIQVNGTE